MGPTGGGHVAVRRVREEDWAQLRDLRLRMLLDTPTAYLETHEHALGLDERHWRARARRCAGGQQCTLLVAVGPDGRWLGQMGGVVEAPGVVTVFAVFVDPAHRGPTAGVADRLLAAVDDWARAVVGATELRLLVHEANARARGYYRRAGFTETGATVPYELDPTAREIEMVRPTRAARPQGAV